MNTKRSGIYTKALQSGLVQFGDKQFRQYKWSFYPILQNELHITRIDSRKKSVALNTEFR